MIVTENGYMIFQKINDNSLHIQLPQTTGTLRSTVGAVSNRKLSLSDEEEAMILMFVMGLYERE